MMGHQIIVMMVRVGSIRMVVFMTYEFGNVIMNSPASWTTVSYLGLVFVLQLRLGMGVASPKVVDVAQWRRAGVVGGREHEGEGEWWRGRCRGWSEDSWRC